MPRLLLLLLAAASFTLGSSPGAEPAADEARLLTEVRQLTYEGRRAGEGYFHPDGNALIFQSEREAENPFYQIYLLDLLSGESARVSPGAGKTTCAFFQPGTSRVLFASTHHDPGAPAAQKAELEFRASGKQRRYAWDYDPAFEIFTCQQDGTQMVRLTDAPGYDAEAAFSPDGKQIVFCSTREAHAPGVQLSDTDRARLEKDPAWFGDIHIMNADGSNVRRLTSAPGYDGGPFFSPDGERIVWRRFDERGMNADVYTMKLDGSDVRRITDFASMSWAPYYHPSGKYVIFTSNKLGFENFELFLVDAAGERAPVRATFTGGFDGLPVFSPGGERLCWTSNRTGDSKSQLFMGKWNHEAALAALAAAPLRNGAPVTSTPGKAPPAAPAVSAAGPFSAEITQGDLRAQVAWLADGAREGRMTGGAGARSSAEWAAAYFQQLGLKTAGKDFFNTFEFHSGVTADPTRNSLTATVAPKAPAPTAQAGGGEPRNFTFDQDFRPLSFSDSGNAEGGVVFAGYGLSAPEAQGAARYNSYDGLDVKDKVVLVLRYVPEAVDPQRRAQLNRYAGLRYKALMARERGAKAVLFVSGPNSSQAGELLPLSSDNTLAGSGIVAFSINGPTADALLAPSGKSLKDLQTALDNENPHVEGGFAIPGLHVRVASAIEHQKKTDRNVVAVLPPAQESGEYIVIGAHYDHLGRGSGTNSLAKAGEESAIHHGADDNASGTALVLELAASLARERAQDPAKFRRGVIFALWSGEEIGLIGSSSFAEKPPVEIGKIAAYLNFDMVGRLRDNKLTLQGVGSSKLWRKLIEKRNVAAGFQLVLQDDPYLPTDTTSFYPKRIPVLNFFTGAHEDYHRPTDTADKLNTEGLERITKFSQQLVMDLVTAAERPDYSRVERSEQPGGSRETLRAYLGTIPDYTTEVQGVKISGVRGGSPGEKAGLKGGDVIVELAGQKITNIYDYTYALDAVKVGQPVKMMIQRDGKSMDVSVTPEARK